VAGAAALGVGCSRGGGAPQTSSAGCERGIAAAPPQGGALALPLHWRPARARTAAAARRHLLRM
jgi:hypothetical protein